MSVTTFAWKLHWESSIFVPGLGDCRRLCEKTGEDQGEEVLLVCLFFFVGSGCGWN